MTTMENIREMMDAYICTWIYEIAACVGVNMCRGFLKWGTTY